MIKAVIKDHEGTVRYENNFTKSYEEVKDFMEKLIFSYGIGSTLEIEESSPYFFEITTDLGNTLTFVTEDEEDKRVLAFPIYEQEDYVRTEYGLYPKIEGFVVAVYDWYNTIKINNTSKYISVGCDDVVVFDTETKELQVSPYR